MCGATLVAAVFILSATARGVPAEKAAAAPNEICRAYDWFWVWYEHERGRDRISFALRPFYIKNGTGDSFFQASLMPFMFWRYRTPEHDRWVWFFGLGRTDEVRRDGGRDYDFGFFPLLFFGIGKENERYALLWPFGGTLRGKFGTSRITAALFPGVLLFFFFPPSAVFSYTTLAWGILSLLPVYLSYEIGDFKAWSVLWPLFHYGRGAKREEIRLFPFYAHLHKDGWYDRYSFLFVINYQRLYYRDDLHHILFIFPLFGRKWSRSERMSSVTFLWPFFSWGYDKRIGDWELNIPWPLVQFKDCENPKIHKRIFFPVYGIYRYVNNETLFITPLYFRLKKSSPRFNSEQHFVFFIFWHYRRDYHAAADPRYGTRWRYFKMWPIFSMEWNDAGERAFNLFSLLPFRDRDGYEAMYEPFWSIIEYRRLANGERRLGLFLRLWYQRWGGGTFRLKIPILISIGRRENRLTEVGFFESMFGYAASRKGRYLRILWIPLRIGDTEGFPPDEECDDDPAAFSDGGLSPSGKEARSVGVTHVFGWSGGSGEVLPEPRETTIAPRGTPATGEQ